MSLRTLGWRTVILTAALFVILTLPSFQRNRNGWHSRGEFNVTMEKVTSGWPWPWFQSITYTRREGTPPPLTMLPEGREWTPGTHLLWWRFFLQVPFYTAGGIILAIFYTYVLLPSVHDSRRRPAWRLLLCSMYGIAFFAFVWVVNTPGRFSELPTTFVIVIGIFLCFVLLPLGLALTVYRCASYLLSATACILLLGATLWSAMVFQALTEGAVRFTWDWEEVRQALAFSLPPFLIPSLILTMVRRIRVQKELSQNQEKSPESVSSPKKVS